MKKRVVSLMLALALCMGLAVTPASAAEGGPAVSSNINAQDYTTWSKPVKSYLYENETGGLTRVEYIGGQIVVEDYSPSFQLLDSRTIPMELSIWGGFFDGEDCNFFVFGQENPGENDSTEVIRVVKYSKDWQRLGQASLKGANTTVPFDAGCVRMDEYGGYLYIRTCHEMYKYTDGVNHQANLMFVVRQRDMSVSDSFYDIAWTESGYVSHSFNQFILIDRDGYPVTLDHGDADPTRGVAFRKYYANASTGKFTGQQWGTWCSRMNLIDFGGSSGNNTTGAAVGGLAETSDSYIFAFHYNGTGSGSGDRTVYLQMMDIATGKGRQYKISGSTGVGSTTPVLAPAGLEGGWLLWNGKSGYTVSDTLYYLWYDAQGNPGAIQTGEAALSDCQPIPYSGGVVWYVTDNSAPVFYTLDESGVTRHSSEGGAEQPGQTTQPGQAQEPEQPVCPDGADQPGDSQSGIISSPNSTFAPGLAITADGTLWGWGEGLSAWGKTWDGSNPVRLGSGYTAVSGEVGEAFLLKEDGTLWFQGAYLPYYGYLDKPSPNPVQLLDHVVQFCNGIALKEDGSVWSLIPPSEEEFQEDVMFYHVMDDVKQVSGGLYGSEFGMALKNDGTLWSWGHNNNASLGRNTGEQVYAPPAQILDHVAYVSGTMAIRTDGTLWSWGDNYFGAVGDGSGQTQYDPVQVMDHVVGAWCYPDTQMTTKYAMTEDGALYSWGFGALGYEDGNTIYEANPSIGISSFSYQTIPRKVDFSGAVSVWVGRSVTYVLREDGSLWGTGNGYLGLLNGPEDEVVTGFIPLMDGLAVAGQGESEEPGQSQESEQPSQPQQPASTVSDAPASFWGSTYIQKAAQAGLMTGTGAGTFDPNGNLTLAQAMVLAYQIHSQANGGSLPQAAGAWYMPYYQYCVDNGLLAGQFDPSRLNQTASRFDMVAILDKAIPAGRMTAERAVPDGAIPDLDEGDAYGEAVYRWYRAGIVTGDQSGRFNGTSSITRAETAVILCQINQLV